MVKLLIICILGVPKAVPSPLHAAHLQQTVNTAHRELQAGAGRAGGGLLLGVQDTALGANGHRAAGQQSEQGFSTIAYSALALDAWASTYPLAPLPERPLAPFPDMLACVFEKLEGKRRSEECPADGKLKVFEV